MTSPIEPSSAEAIWGIASVVMVVVLAAVATWMLYRLVGKLSR